MRISARSPLKHIAFPSCLQHCLSDSFITCCKDIPVSTRDSKVSFLCLFLSTFPFSSFHLICIFFISNLNHNTTSLHFFLYFFLIIISCWVLPNEQLGDLVFCTFSSYDSLPGECSSFKRQVLLFKNTNRISLEVFVLVMSNIFCFS